MCVYSLSVYIIFTSYRDYMHMQSLCGARSVDEEAEQAAGQRSRGGKGDNLQQSALKPRQ